MDWGRAKTILIISFLILNVMLGYQLWSDRISQTGAEGDTADLVEETNKLLESKNIQVLANVPKDTPKLMSINVHIKEAYRAPKVTMLERPIRFASLLSRGTIRDIQNKSTIDHFDVYRLDTSYVEEGVHLYHQVYKELPMFDVRLELYSQNGEITGYKQSYVEVKSEGDVEEADGQRIISAYSAVRSLAESYLSEGAVITDIRLGYHGQLYDSEEQTFVPNWRVMLSDGQPYYVHAFTGAVEAIQPEELILP